MNFSNAANMQKTSDCCHRDMVSQPKSLEIEAEKAGLKINTTKCKSMRCNFTNINRFKKRNVNMDDVTFFWSHGSIITNTGGSSSDVSYRISKSSQAFGMLSPIWKTTFISLNAKIKLFNACVKSVLLYANETWKALPGDLNNVQVFFNLCLRRILRNNQTSMMELLNSKWRWIGHTLLRPTEDIEIAAIGWTPQGNTIRRGRPLNK